MGFGHATCLRIAALPRIKRASSLFFSLYYQRIDRGWPAVQSQLRAAQAAPGPGAALDRFGRSASCHGCLATPQLSYSFVKKGFIRLLNWFSGRIDARDFNAFGRNGFGNKILQVVWTGARYSLTDKLDVIGRILPLYQNSYYGSSPCWVSHGLAPAIDGSWRLPRNSENPLSSMGFGHAT